MGQQRVKRLLLYDPWPPLNVVLVCFSPEFIDHPVAHCRQLHHLLLRQRPGDDQIAVVVEEATLLLLQ